MGSIAQAPQEAQSESVMTMDDAQVKGAQKKTKLFGRAFYESIGSPKLILAPMVDQSEFAWRMLTRSFMTPDESKNLVAYSPMLHARLFADQQRYRESHFQPTRAPRSATADTKNDNVVDKERTWRDGNPQIDRPLFVQFCANDPDALLSAAQHVQEHCDAVDLNLGCPQGIARKGHYGAFLQEDWDLIYRLINNLHLNLDIPVTAKMRILETKEKTLDYAKMILRAGVSILTVHGRQREQKGHNTGLADWSVIRYLREQLPAETVLFANGNVLQYNDIERCLQETGVDGVMSAEGNLYDPTIFAKPPAAGDEGRDYWRGIDGKGGYRMDAVLRRYVDILYKYVVEAEPPQRKPLFLPSDPVETSDVAQEANEAGKADEAEDESQDGQPPKKRQKRADAKKDAGQNKKKATRLPGPNMGSIQPHLFHMLRPLVTKHTNVRDALARYHGHDMEGLEHILALVEEVVKEGLLEYEKDHAENGADVENSEPATGATANGSAPALDPTESSEDAIARCKRPYFVCQPHIRPLPAEAFAKGSMQLSKKELKKLEDEKEKAEKDGTNGAGETRQPNGKVEVGKSEVERADVLLKDAAVAG